MKNGVSVFVHMSLFFAVKHVVGNGQVFYGIHHLEIHLYYYKCLLNQVQVLYEMTLNDTEYGPMTMIKIGLIGRCPLHHKYMSMYLPKNVV